MAAILFASNSNRDQLPLPRFFQTSGDVPAVGQARLHAPSGYQPRLMHIWHNSPLLRKSRSNVEILTGRFSAQLREESSEPCPPAQ